MSQEPAQDPILETVAQTLEADWQTIVAKLPWAAVALVLLAVFFFIGRLVGRGVGALLDRGRFSTTHRDFFCRVARWIVYLVGIAVAMKVLGLGAAAAGLLAGGGITAIVLGFAFREIGENFLAGFFLAFSRPFEVDDLIESDGLKGRVREIELRYTHIRTADGRDIYIPNSQIFNKPLVNFTRDGKLRPSFTIGIDYGDDPERARALMLESIGAVAGVESEPAPTVSISAFEENYIELEAVFWIDSFNPDVVLPEVRSRAMDASRRALREAGYTLSTDVQSRLAVDVRSADGDDGKAR